MKPLNITYLKTLILIILFCSSSCVHHAQTKSSVTKVIEGKKFIIHTVEKGQSLYAISKTYGLDVSTVLSYNQDAINGLKVGQELKIPTDIFLTKPAVITSSTIDTNYYKCHKIGKGETIYGITKKYNIDEKTLLNYNPSITNGLKEGEFLIVGVKNNKTQIPTKQTFPTVISNNTNTINKTIYSNTDSILLLKSKKTAYRIGLFLPFKLNQLDFINIDELVQKKSSFPSSQAISIDFYTGFKKMMDSMSTQNFEVTLSLFDIDEQDSAKIESLSKTVDFKRLDLIVGPLNLTEFKLVSNKAKELNIPAVSPLIQNNKILFNNSMLSKVTPSQHTLIEGLADYCLDSLTNSNVILVNTTAKDLHFTKTFKKRFNDNLINYGKTSKDTLHEVKGIAGVKASYRSDKKNIVVVFTNNPVYLQDFITQLANFSDKKDIVLLGFNSVSNIENLDQEYLNKLHFHFANNNHIDYNDYSTRLLAKYYQDIYNTEPSEYYYSGYDIASYYLSLLKNEGLSSLAKLDKLNSKGLSIDFKFYRPDSSTGFENRAMSIFKYENYKVVKTGW